jgi:hypothetical protein
MPTFVGLKSSKKTAALSRIRSKNGNIAAGFEKTKWIALPIHQRGMENKQ